MCKLKYIEQQEIVISVIMGIYNCADTLEEAIECILKQTETRWELIMCDDGSSDRTYEIALKYCEGYPGKIHVIRNQRNMGLNKTLNNCLHLAKGKYIARMDGDDVCASNRFEEELKVFDNEPEIFIVGSNMLFFDEFGVWGNTSCVTYPEKRDFLKGTPFCHATCMVRREAYDAVGGYSEDERLLRVEDYHLWLKMYMAGFKGKNLEIPLYSMRDDRNAYNRRKMKYRLNEAYVKYLVVKGLNLSRFGYLTVLRPIIVGLLPAGIYNVLHKRNLKMN